MITSRLYRSLKWIIEMLQKKEFLTFEEINDLWVKEESLSKGLELQRKTFYNNRKVLKETFGLEVCSKEKGDYAYYIKNPEILWDNSLMLWMLNNLAMDEKLVECKALFGRIVMEIIPSGGKTLDCITDAMLNNSKLCFNYIKYGSSEMAHHTVEPWGLVLYHQ